MNIILEQREDILTNNNTAQKQFLTFLNKTHKSSETIIIQESLFGKLDLSVLNQFGFNKVKKISFDKGFITDIINFPNNVTELNIPNNLIINFSDLPSNLEILNIENNFVSELDFSELTQLKEINISHNNFSELNNLSPSLTHIICNNNKLSYVNLFELNDLKILNASNNNITIIDNLPNNLIELIVENNPNIQYHNTNSIPNTKENSNNSNYLSCLQQYFKLKNDYFNNLLNKKRSVYKKAPNKASGRRIAATVKPTCIYCKRNVGTLFSYKSKHYKAICGDTVNPCALKIDIFTGDLYNIFELIETFDVSLKELREDIINLKLDSLFDYNSKETSLKLYEQKLKDYTDESETFQELIEKYNELFFMDDEKKKIYDDNRILIKNKTDDVNKLLQEYKETDNIQLLKEAVQIQIDDIIPTIKNNNFLEFEKIYVDLNIDKNFQLYKEKIGYSNLELYQFGEKSKVIDFKIQPSVEKNELNNKDSLSSTDTNVTPVNQRLL